MDIFQIYIFLRKEGWKQVKIKGAIFDRYEPPPCLLLPVGFYLEIPNFNQIYSTEISSFNVYACGINNILCDIYGESYTKVTGNKSITTNKEVYSFEPIDTIIAAWKDNNLVFIKGYSDDERDLYLYKFKELTDIGLSVQMGGIELLS